jgi:hypothetical protein
MSEPVHAQSFESMLCNIWQRPICRIVSGGTNTAEDSVEIKCHSCKNVHRITRRELEKMWEELRNPVEEASIHQDV